MRIHHGLNRIKREVDVLYQFFNENNFIISFMPARYLYSKLNPAILYSGLTFLRNIKMYTIYSVPIFEASTLEESTVFKLQLHDALSTSLLTPLAMYYSVNE